MLAIDSEKERLRQNDIVFTRTIIYWVLFFATYLVLFIGSIFYKKYHKKKNPLLHRRLNDPKNENKKSNNKYLSKAIHYLILGILIVIFEYLFFQYCVLKYKIISNDELKYLIMDQLGVYFYN